VGHRSFFSADIIIKVGAPIVSIGDDSGAAKRSLLWTANLIWISLVLFIATTVLLVVTLHHAGGHMGAHIQQLPAGVIAVNGWANRLFVVIFCVWVAAVARTFATLRERLDCHS
jgi:hypothetical protein